MNSELNWLKLMAITAIHHRLDFSYKVCDCRRNKKIILSTFNQKGEHVDGSQDPVSGIGDGVFILDILMKPAKYNDCILWQDVS